MSEFMNEMFGNENGQLINEEASAKDIKKEIVSKTTLRASDISATTSYGGYSSSIRIKVKKLYPLSKIEEIANKYQKIDRDERSGEILSGGNSFVFVEYDSKTKIPSQIEDAIDSTIADAVERNGGQHSQVHVNTVASTLKREYKNLFKDYSDGDMLALISLHRYR